MEYEKLIKNCTRNDRKAQHELFETYSDSMYLVAFRYLGNRYAAEEVITNSFLKIFRSLESVQFESENKFQAWMRKVVVNESLMEIRKIKQMPLFTNEFPEIISDMDFSEQTYFDELVLLIDRLPNGYQLVFRLFVIEGYSHSEISELLNISEGTSKSQLHKARLQLQQMLIKTVKNDE